MRRSVVLSLLIIGMLFLGVLTFSPPKSVSADANTFSHQVFLPFLTNGNSNNSNSQPEDNFPSLIQFVDTVKNGENKIVGVYIDNLMAKPVVQQPQGNYEFISSDPNTITQFMLTTPGVVGLLAHNHLAGKSFFEIKPGDRVFIIEGNGLVSEYQVSEIDSFQVIKTDGVSKYLNVHTSEMLDAGQLFAKFYMGEPHITLQTCIAKDGDPAWGRLFIIAVPVN
jgi:hypothetical protein